MAGNELYPDDVIPTLRFRFCPMCAVELEKKALFDDAIPRVTCPSCGWIQLMSNTVGVATIALLDNGIAVIEPPGEDGIGLPAGLVEYNESPDEGAVREVLEETGLHAVVTDRLGWHFFESAGWPGPMVQFFFEAEVQGGHVRGSEEGDATIYPADALPPVSSKRTGSQLALQAYREKLARGTD